MNEAIFTDFLETPIGEIEITANSVGLLTVYFVESTQPVSPNHLTESAKTQLSEYFAGQRHSFDLPLAPVGTDFQQQVWQQLNLIPFGETRSYAEIANLLDKPKAVRAVGAANGKNPISIIVPCHRVIGSNGTLTGYAGGLERKSWLLALENSQQAMAV